MADTLKQLCEIQSVWERLKATGKPIVLYGMGDGAEKIMRVLDAYGIQVTGFFASDAFVRGQSFHGFQVMRYDEAREQYGDFFAVVCFGVHDDETIKRIHQISGEVELVIPDVPVCGEGLFTPAYLRENLSEFEQAYTYMADDRSREVLLELVRFKLTGELPCLDRTVDSLESCYEEILCPTGGEVYVDLGAYDGDTIRAFLNNAKSAKSIFAFEPDPKNFVKLERTIAQLESESVVLPNQIIPYQLAAYSKEKELFFADRAGRNSALTTVGQAIKGKQVQANSVDNILFAHAPTFIKFDLEGTEPEALMGCERTIATYAPKLMVAAYHRNEDLHRLPNLIKQLNKNYRLYLRRQEYIPAWEINLFAV